MTRKRFIKLLMACGDSRNNAECFAKTINKMHIPYKDAIMKVYRYNLKWGLATIFVDRTFYQGR